MNLPAVFLAVIAAHAQVQSSTAPVILDFQASWCGPCRQMKPRVQELTRKHYPVREVDIDQDPETARKYHVQQVPTFIIVDSNGVELERTAGLQPAAQLERLYLKAKAELVASRSRGTGRSHAESNQFEDEQDDRSLVDEDLDRRSPASDNRSRADHQTDDPGVPENHRVRGRIDDENQAKIAKNQVEERRRPNPDPWQTVVRIKVHGAGLIGFGSGTVVASDENESLILTCSHIFHIENSKKQPTPARFPRKVTVDLFDGRLASENPAVVRCVERDLTAEVIDYDHDLDLGLIRIRPGKRLPAAKVVPPRWRPDQGMSMVTVGCSEGHDATAWSTVITNPRTGNVVQGHHYYSAIECAHAPRQGRSGGGLFTDDGYIAGVCNFAYADPGYPRGLYAAPISLYKFLDRNELTALYDPKPERSNEALLASRGRSGGRNDIVTRGQSPENDSTDPDRITIPPPELAGIRSGFSQTRKPITRRTGWRPVERENDLDRGAVGEHETTRRAEKPIPEDNSNSVVKFHPVAADFNDDDTIAKPTGNVSERTDSEPVATSRSQAPGSHWQAVRP
jgi:thiol-disulfide isomerase/thioredoxin